ncbi:MAG: YvcK family protein [Anaerolineae bacterium]|nr:YvcK family protein [Anaerolineae bacterium]
MARRRQSIRKWLTPGIGIKRWLLLFGFGITLISITIGRLVIDLFEARDLPLPTLVHIVTLGFLPIYARVIVGIVVGFLAVLFALYELNHSILAPFVYEERRPLIDVMYSHSRLNKGLKLVALGGGTGLPSVLRGFKKDTSNITAIVTVADDGGSSGKLRRELGVLPPGDLRNNIAALADDEDLMTQLFQYRFGEGGLEGHAFGNLFLTVLANITGSMDRALIEAGKVLAIQGRVLPSTLHDVNLMAEVRTPDGAIRRVVGESQIPEVGGKIERVSVSPENARAYPEAIRAILSADLIVIGPGSLFTSIIPNLLINGIPEAIRSNKNLRIYVCNIATQEGETDNFTVADHILALEKHIGRGLFNIVVANNAYPTANAGPNTNYVQPAPPDHDVRKRYEICEADLTDPQYPWRHNPVKLNRAIMGLLTQRQQHPTAETKTVEIG